mmetsp:Transcript_22538/g.50501  ORF Transcript_22538/g.50501 Transcript_22538/m.50501 type:complete len:217 (-) Transcript_22538:233-883(-)
MHVGPHALHCPAARPCPCPALQQQHRLSQQQEAPPVQGPAHLPLYAQTGPLLPHAPRSAPRQQPPHQPLQQTGSTQHEQETCPCLPASEGRLDPPSCRRYPPRAPALQHVVSGLPEKHLGQAQLHRLLVHCVLAAPLSQIRQLAPAPAPTDPLSFLLPLPLLWHTVVPQGSYELRAQALGLLGAAAASVQEGGQSLDSGGEGVGQWAVAGVEIQVG